MPAFPEEFVSDADLVIEAKKSLYERNRLLDPDQTLSAIKDLKKWIDQELAFEEAATASLGRSLSELWHAEYLDQLPPLLNRFERLVAAYFVRRGSVTAFHGYCNAWRSGVLQRILHFAEEGPELDDLGHAPAPYALLAAGAIGRREQTLEEADRYFLIWRGDDADYFEPFAYRVIALLDQYDMLGKDGPTLTAGTLWRGSLNAWCGYLDESAQAPAQSNAWEFLPDLRHVAGDEAIGNEAVRQARSCQERNRGNRAFADYARYVIDIPVALGLLGSIKVERSGEHAGCCNPEDSGLQPLVEAVRLLAAHHDLDSLSTLDRLTQLQFLGVLELSRVERLSAAYHLLAGLKVRREIAMEQPFLNPDQLPESEREKLREALEEVRQLQRFLRSALLGWQGDPAPRAEPAGVPL